MALGFALVAGLPAAAAAQSGNVAVQGMVPGAANFDQAGAQALQFGEMTPGASTADRVVSLLSTALDAVNGNAGTIDVRLNKSGTALTFSLPASLSGSGGNTLPVDSYACGYELGNTAAAPPATPAGTGDLDGYDAGCDGSTSLAVALSGARMVRIYLGGVVLGSAIDAALADSYSGTITVTATVP